MNASPTPAILRSGILSYLIPSLSEVILKRQQLTSVEQATPPSAVRQTRSVSAARLTSAQALRLLIGVLVFTVGVSSARFSHHHDASKCPAGVPNTSRSHRCRWRTRQRDVLAVLAGPVLLVVQTEPAELTALVRQELAAERPELLVPVCSQTKSSYVRILLDHLHSP